MTPSAAHGPADTSRSSAEIVLINPLKHDVRANSILDPLSERRALVEQPMVETERHARLRPHPHEVVLVARVEEVGLTALLRLVEVHHHGHVRRLPLTSAVGVHEAAVAVRRKVIAWRVTKEAEPLVQTDGSPLGRNARGDLLGNKGAQSLPEKLRGCHAVHNAATGPPHLIYLHLPASSDVHQCRFVAARLRDFDQLLALVRAEE
mmetsp:Transcript_2840/g.4640  ORF Transcript_2840/g.4640 Transcript_2840/m.4640 type:complete len:206 (-) Transcript_2840:244-861(-)